ncbi:VanZ family protein [Paenarthrobacter sp. NPDC092416]|uniref:VanZ family protein n=1 Tax=Paenarthrobacter sp. NPDC092416 TaxID=3364386 RepID=UPI00380A6AA3
MKNPLPWRICLATYLVGLAAVGSWPTPVDKPIQGTLASLLNYLHHHGVPEWFSYSVIEVSANVAMFVPLGILAAMALPTRAWWHIAGIGLFVSTCMELGQLFFITARFSTVVDVVTNTLGTVIGIGAARLIAPRKAPGLAEAY